LHLKIYPQCASRKLAMHRTKSEHDASRYGIHGFEAALEIGACDIFAAFDAPIAQHDRVSRCSKSFSAYFAGFATFSPVQTANERPR
jgi:hypothetical protein